VHAYATTGWENFFVAEAGAAAALTGLIFVAVSINLSKILASAWLPGRAFETLIVLLGVLLVSTAGLVPQPPTALGLEIAVIGGLVWLMSTVDQMRLLHVSEARRWWILSRTILSQLATVPFVIGGISLCLRAGGGLYWVFAAVIWSFIAGVMNGWVLLVEILR
jgi:modulator of FtsH protease